MKIGCVLVLFNPDIELLKKSVSALYNQVNLFFLSDNSTVHFDISNLDDYKEKILYQKMSGNIGIASAQNIGVQFFIDNDYDFLIFMDQDSIAPKNLIQELSNSYKILSERGINVGGIGPRPVNRQSNKDYKGVFKKGMPYNESITEVISLISSATLIPIVRFKQVGLLESGLFIDGVDHEWCWRARYKKELRFFISENAKLSHQLGEGDKKLLGIDIAISTPFRSYYQYRNYFILLRRGYVPNYWKFMNGIKYLIKYFYYPICINPRLEHFKNIHRGIFNGIFYKQSKNKK